MFGRDDELHVVAREPQRRGRPAVAFVETFAQFAHEAARERRRTAARIDGERQLARSIRKRRAEVALTAARIAGEDPARARFRDDGGIDVGPVGRGVDESHTLEICDRVNA